MYQHALLAALSLSLLGGCANLSTVSRTSALPDSAVAVHLDSAQRLVYANKNGFLCAEPTPDALQSYANAFGGSAGTRSNEAVSLSNAFTANAMGVGLHTQSITLMRDILYRICEQSHNGRLSNMDVTQLLQRAQDLTLGVLAIEQLTGAVTARQPMLINTAASSAASAINDTQAQLEIARKREEAGKAALEAATSGQTAAKTALDAADAALAAEKTKPAGEQDADAIAALSEKVAALQSELTLREGATQAADASYKSAVAATRAIEAMAEGRVASANSATGGAGVFADPGSRTGLDKAATEKIAAATVDIVKAVINKGHLTDSCMNFFTHQVGGGAAGLMTREQVSGINELCSKVIQANIDAFMKGPGTVAPVTQLGVGAAPVGEGTGGSTPAALRTEAPPRAWRELSAKLKPGATLTKEQVDALFAAPAAAAPPKK